GGESGPLLDTVADSVARLVATGRVAVVATTARPEMVGSRMRGHGLLERTVAVGLPDRDQRARMLGFLTRAMPLAPDVHLEEVAARTPGFVVADLASLVREAAVRAAHREEAAGGDQPAVRAEDFAAALEVVRPTAMDGQSLEVTDLTLDDVGDLAEVKQA